MGGAGNVDGAGAAARFNLPQGVATDSSGNVYVGDMENHTVRKITPAGAVSTFAGTPDIFGTADGTGAAARFHFPRGVATDGADNVYVADEGNNTIRKITPDGVVTTLAGRAGFSGSGDGIGAAARFDSPVGVATDNAGNVYVADMFNNAIRKVTPAGVVSTLAGTAGVFGSADGTGAAASFFFPRGVVTDGAGNVYVADTSNHTIRKITPAGVVSTLAGTAGAAGSADATGTAASFRFPRGIATDSAGNLYVSELVNNTIRKITPAGVVTTLAGTAGGVGSVDGTGAAASFNFPSSVATDSASNVYVADGNHTIRKVTPAGVVSTLAGTSGVSGSTDAAGAAARFNSPAGVATDSAGNVYVADSSNNTIRKITPAGAVTTLAGTAGVSGSSDGTGAAASFNFPRGIATDGAGNVYVADTSNNTIRKITSSGVVTTLAGTASFSGGSSDGTGTAASFNFPQGLATDSAGNIYVADSDNNTIRKITPAGVVTTLAGTAGVFGSADGTGATASFDFPCGIATDSVGNVYVADSGNSTIRKITPAGVVSTLAGTAALSGSADGTGAAASFNFPFGIAADSAGNVYVADLDNSTIRQITPTGFVVTVVGRARQAEFAPGPLPGLLAFPLGVAVSGRSLYIALNNGVAVVRGLTGGEGG